MKLIGLFLILIAGAAGQQFASSAWSVKDGEATAVFGPPRAMPVVTGAPYSAVELQEYNPPEGNAIPASDVIGHFARDAQGRTRTQRTFKMAPVWLVEIYDPVAGVAYLLDDQKKVAHRMPLPPASVQESLSPQPGPQTNVERLGNQTLEGLTVEGTRTTAGIHQPGRPALTVERWDSPDLKVTILTKSTNGYITRLTSLTRLDPDPALFSPPPGYTVIDENAPFSMSISAR